MSERKDQELTIITKARDLVDETMSRTKKFDKRLRFTLSNRIDEKALDVLEAIVEANEINPTIETDPRRRANLCMARFDLLPIHPARRAEKGRCEVSARS